MKFRLFAFATFLAAVLPVCFVVYSVKVDWGRPQLVSTVSKQMYGFTEFHASIVKASWPNPFGVRRIYILHRYEHGATPGDYSIREDVLRLSWRGQRLVGELACYEGTANAVGPGGYGCRLEADFPGANADRALMFHRERARAEFKARQLTGDGNFLPRIR
ncbi:MAG TPA: hypothetical protein VMJ72_01445 [Candidatus Paceibacterota bacterium]|nr:hypothetical protein [Candidatus Paceibacterota bacterium]